MKRFLIFFLVFTLLLSGCAQKQTQDFGPADGDTLVIYTSHKKEVWWPIVKEFESRTGLWVQVWKAAPTSCWKPSAPARRIRFRT